jgi:hypothetical protein
MCRLCRSLLSFCVFGHCIVCSSSIYGFWLPPFGISKNLRIIANLSDEIFYFDWRHGIGAINGKEKFGSAQSILYTVHNQALSVEETNLSFLFMIITNMYFVVLFLDMLEQYNFIYNNTWQIIDVCFMVLKTTFNNISAISWRSVELVEETGGPRENRRPVASLWQTLSHNVVHLTLTEIRTHSISGDRHYSHR